MRLRECRALLLPELVEVIHSANASRHVVYVCSAISGLDAHFGEPGSHRSPQIMQRPTRHDLKILCRRLERSGLPLLDVQDRGVEALLCQSEGVQGLVTNLPAGEPGFPPQATLSSEIGWSGQSTAA